MTWNEIKIAIIFFIHFNLIEKGLSTVSAGINTSDSCTLSR